MLQLSSVFLCLLELQKKSKISFNNFISGSNSEKHQEPALCPEPHYLLLFILVPSHFSSCSVVTTTQRKVCVEVCSGTTLQLRSDRGASTLLVSLCSASLVRVIKKAKTSRKSGNERHRESSVKIKYLRQVLPHSSSWFFLLVAGFTLFVTLSD